MTESGLNDDLLERIHAARALPSPPVVTGRLIELGENPDANIAEIVEVLNTDAALVARLLRLANSPLYAGRRRTENLRQAVVALGLDTVLTASLSLTLLNDRTRNEGQPGLAKALKQRCWTRSVHAAACAQNLAPAVAGVTASQAFLAALLQDLGIQVIARLEPTTYAEVPSTGTHDDLLEAEVAGVGVDHAAIGGELLMAWGLPPRVVAAVRASHDFEHCDDAEVASLAGIVAVSGWVADGIAGEPGALCKAAEAAQLHLGIDEDAFGDAIDKLFEALPDLDQILNARVPRNETLIEAAEELLLIRQVRSQMAAIELEKRLVAVTSVAEELKIQSRLDPLTGLSNRRDMDDFLEREFRLAESEEFPLSVLFIDLDDFKRTNDRFGHKVGDEVLIQAARRISGGVRDGDLVGRFGGEEFLVILPGADRSGSEVVADRLTALFRGTPFDVGPNESVVQTVSIGAATRSRETAHVEAEDLISAADHAMYVAKGRGKNQWLHVSGVTRPSSSSLFALG